MGARLQHTRLRLFRSSHSRSKRHRLLNMSWTHRSHGVHGASRVAAYGVVPRLPSRSGETNSPARAGFQHGLHAARKSTRAGRKTDHGIPHPRFASTHELLHLPSMNGRKQLDEALAHWHSRLPSSGRFYWRSLEELAESEAFHELVKQEFPEQADTWPDARSEEQTSELQPHSF